MKNLKKVLALGLALVMMLGMFTVASAAETKKTASDFTDWDKVEHKDAVALCVDLGIINGLPDGSFGPDQTIDRASWSKLVYFTATGDDNADAYLGTATGLKDIAGNWAESYINYLYANDYITGDGLGNYLPSGTVTVAAGAKTMLTVLGYDADDRGYQNDPAWAGNIMTDAKRNGLMDEIDRAQTAMVNLTRDNAAQLVYNALQANTVEAENGRDNGEKYVTKYNPTGNTLGFDVFSIKPVTATVVVNSEGAASLNVTDANGTGVRNNDLKDVSVSAALAGENVTLFVKVNGKNSFDSVVSSSVVKAADSAAAVFTGGVKLADLSDDKADDYVADAPSTGSIAYYLDGVPSNATAVGNAAVAGNKIEVYTKDNALSMIKATTYFVDKVEGDVETRTRNDELQVKVPGVITSWTAADKVEGYQGLAEDDIVLVNLSAGNYTIEKAEKVTGKVTRKSGSKLTLAGTQYEASGIENKTGENSLDVAGWNVKDKADNEYDFYLDKNGTVCYCLQVSGEVETKVAYVLRSALVEGGSGLNAASAYVEVELLFADATTEIVRIDKIADKDEDFAAADATGLASKLVDYSVNSKGNYEVTVKADQKAITGEIKQEPVFNGTLSADNKTVFIVEKVARKTNGNKDGDAQYFVYTGFKAVPKMTAVEGTAFVDGTVTYAFISTTRFTGDGSDGLIYVKSADYDEDVSGNKVYSIVNAEGEEVSMALTGVTITKETVNAHTFYTIESTDDDGVATIKAIDSKVDEDTTISCGNGVVTVKGKSVSYDNSTVAVLIDINEKGDFDGVSDLSLDSFKVDATSFDYVVKMIASDGNAEFVYVVRTAKA